MSPFAVPIVLFVMIGLVVIARVIFRGPFGDALAERVRGGASGDSRLHEEVDQLRLEVDELRGQLGEAQERLDFTERLLARREETFRLPGAGGADGPE